MYDRKEAVPKYILLKTFCDVFCKITADIILYATVSFDFKMTAACVRLQGLQNSHSFLSEIPNRKEFIFPMQVMLP